MEIINGATVSQMSHLKETNYEKDLCEPSVSRQNGYQVVKFCR